MPSFLKMKVAIAATGIVIGAIGNAAYAQLVPARQITDLYQLSWEAHQTGTALDPANPALPQRQAAYFAATDSSDPQAARQLWLTEGTSGSTRKISDLRTVSVFANPNGVGAYFAATTPEFGTELYFTDGMPSGTHLLMDLAPGSASGSFGVLGFIQGKLLIATDSGIAVSDGTVAGTHLVLPQPGYYESAIGRTQAFIYSYSPIRRIWRIGLDPNETRELTPPAPAKSWTAPHYFTVVNDRLCWKDSYTGPFTLYCHDGSATGTAQRITTPGGEYLGLRDDTHFQPFGQQLLFLGNVAGRTYMWTTDGTQAGSHQIGELESLSVCSSSDANGRAYFAQGTNSPYQLWSTAGSPATTSLVMSPHPFAGDMTCSFGASGGPNATLGMVSYFSIRNGIARTDGTAGGTYKLRSDNGATSIVIRDYMQPVVVGRYVVALGPSSSGRDTLWSYDSDGLFAGGFDY